MNGALPARLTAVAAGVWLVVAPALLGHESTALGDSDRIVGPVAAALALVAAWAVLDAVRWATLPCAAWAVASPWLLGADAAGTVSSTAAGAIIAATTFVGAPEEQRLGGGWRSVRPASWRIRARASRSAHR